MIQLLETALVIIVTVFGMYATVGAALHVRAGRQRRTVHQRIICMGKSYARISAAPPMERQSRNTKAAKHLTLRRQWQSEFDKADQPRIERERFRKRMDASHKYHQAISHGCTCEWESTFEGDRFRHPGLEECFYHERDDQ